MHEDRLARFELGVVEQHVLDRSEGDRRECCRDRIDTRRSRDQQAGGQIDLLQREAVQVQAMHAGDVFAEIVALFAAGLAETAGARTVDRHQLTRKNA